MNVAQPDTAAALIAVIGHRYPPAFLIFPVFSVARPARATVLAWESPAFLVASVFPVARPWR